MKSWIISGALATVLLILIIVTCRAYPILLLLVPIGFLFLALGTLIALFIHDVFFDGGCHD